MERTPNRRLRGLLAEAEWTGEALARAVNSVGAEAGRSLSYGRAAVAHWLSGVRSRGPVPEFIVEALSRRLGRTVTLSDAGLDAGRPERSAQRGREGYRWWQGDVLRRMVDLVATAGQEPRHIEVYRLTPQPVPPWHEALAAVSSRPPPGDGPSPRVGTSEVETVKAMAPVFSSADAAQGAGSVRSALGGYLRVVVTPWLRARSRTDVHRCLCTTAAELAYLHGFTCFDEELNGLAQRWYQVALQLAAEAVDPVRYAIVLRAMSVQAGTLGHHRHARQLAEAALSAGVNRAVPLTRAFLLGQAAVANAATADRRQALSHLTTAERQLARASSASSATGVYNEAALAHQRAHVLRSTGDASGAIAAIQDSIRHRPAEERRSRAVTLAGLAEMQLRHGHVQEATTTWHRFLDDYPHVRSARVRSAMGTLRATLLPYRNDTTVQAVLARAVTTDCGEQR